MASLSLKGIQKIYPNGFHAVKDFNLEIADKDDKLFVFDFKVEIFNCLEAVWISFINVR